MRELIRFSLPIVLARIVQTLGLLVGNIFVAQLGLDTLAASALATSISLAVFTFASGCLLSLGPVFSRIRHNPEAESSTLVQGFLLATLLGSAIIVLFCHVDLLLTFVGQSRALIDAVQSYFYALSFAVLPMLWTTLLQQYGLSQRWEKAIFLHSLFRLILGIGCNYVFIFGVSITFFSVPSMGFVGLGIGVSVASWVGFLVLFLWISLKERWWQPGKMMSLYALFMQQKYPSTRTFMQLCRTSFPVGMQLSLEMVVLMVATLLIGHFGHAALGAWQVVSQYVMLFIMIPFGVSQAVAILTGQYIRTQQTTQIMHLSYKGIWLVLMAATVIGSIYILFPQPLVDVYLWQHTDTREALPLLPVFFILMAVYQCLEGIRLVGVGVLRGYLATFRIFVISLVAFAGGSLLVSIVLINWFNVGAVSVVAGLLFGMSTATVLTYWQQITIIKKGNAYERGQTQAVRSLSAQCDIK